jgi:hypothetical protein
MTEFVEIKKQFLPKFKNTNIELFQAPAYCVCHVCKYNQDKHLCPKKCEEAGGSTIDCKIRSCKIKETNPEECDEQIYKILGKPQCLVWNGENKIFLFSNTDFYELNSKDLHCPSSKRG